MDTTAVLLPAQTIRVRRRPRIPRVVIALLVLGGLALLWSLMPHSTLRSTVAPPKHAPVVRVHHAPPADRLTASVAGKVYACTVAPAAKPKPKH